MVAGFDLDLRGVPTPCYVCDLTALDRNLTVLDRVQQEAGCKILLALKGFAMWSVFDKIAEVLPGVTASSVHEAQLGREEFGGEVHACAPAYSDLDFHKLLGLCDHIVFNSMTQLRRHRPAWRDYRGRAKYEVELGLRVNPEHREVPVALYDPCAPGSRLGAIADQIDAKDLDDIVGLHFHSLCELGADALARTLAVFEEKFRALIEGRKWINMGGGHHISRPDYDVDLLIRIVTEFKARHGVEVYLEPGEAIALDTGVLVSSVLDVVHNDVDVAILDTSATAHMPDVLEMPYRPQIKDAGEPGQRAHTYRLGGLTCLAGDVIGDYSFDRPLQVGDRIVFGDMIHYTMVKNTTFNGVRLPSIALAQDGKIDIVREFGYEDFRARLS